MSGKRIVFTGGTGKAGRHAVPHLVAHGYSVLNVDLKPLDLPGVPTLIADLTDNGQAFNALTTHPTFAGFNDGRPPSPPDAVVHFAAIPRVLIEPDNVTFTTNVTSTYNVIEAAMKLGVRKVIIASSETTYGVCFAEGGQGFPLVPARRGLRRRSDGLLRPLQGLQREDRPRLRNALQGRHLCAQDRQRDRAARIRRRSRAMPPTRRCASATPGAISTRAISARSSACAWKRTGSASRCSTRPTIRSRSMSRRPKALAQALSPNTPLTRHDGRVRGAFVEPQDPRSARLQGSPRLAKTRGRLNSALLLSFCLSAVFYPPAPALA